MGEFKVKVTKIDKGNGASFPKWAVELTPDVLTYVFAETGKLAIVKARKVTA